MRVLLVEDEPRVAEFVSRGLAEEGHSVDVEPTGAAALARAFDGSHEVIVLDVGLPDTDGWTVAAVLRARGVRTPILMLTARDAPEDIVRGLDAGADDYLTKPFEFSELLARLRALDRRATTVADQVVTVGDIIVDRVQHQVTRAGVALRLTPIEYRLLDTLVRASGAVVRREELLDRVWGMQFDPGTGLIDVHIGNLRHKLERHGGSRVVVSVKGVGFRFASLEV